MKRPIHLLILVIAAAGSTPRPAAGDVGQVAPATVEVRGEVVDSTRGEPLEGARVLLWGTRHEATTDAEGHFRIGAVPPGDYSAVFFHPRLTELGVASGGRPLSVADRDVEVPLGVPSLFTMAVVTCAGSGGVSVAGAVADVTTELPLPGVEVTFHWVDGDIRRERRVHTDAEGWYRACGLPPERTVAVGASFLDRSAARAEISAPEGSTIHLDLPVARLSPSRLTTTVRDASSRAGVADARVTLGLPGAGRSAVTDGQGRVTFSDVPPGRYSIEVTHLAHATRSEAVDVASDARVAVALDVSPEPIPLAPLEVRVEGFEVPEQRMGGIQITAEEIEAVRNRSRDVADLLQNQRLPGVVVKRDYAGGTCIEFLTGQSRMFRRTCRPMIVIVDGVRVADPYVIFSWGASVIERMQLFRPVDAGIFGLGAGNGVLLITTKGNH